MSVFICVCRTWMKPEVENLRLWYKITPSEAARPVIPSIITKNNTPTVVIMVLLSLPFHPCGHSSKCMFVWNHNLYVVIFPLVYLHTLCEISISTKTCDVYRPSRAVSKRPLCTQSRQNYSTTGHLCHYGAKHVPLYMNILHTMTM